MLRNIPVLDPNTGERSILQGEHTDRILNPNEVYIDAATGEAHEAGSALASMPTHEMYRVPRTTWHAGLV